MDGWGFTCTLLGLRQYYGMRMGLLLCCFGVCLLVPRPGREAGKLAGWVGCVVLGAQTGCLGWTAGRPLPWALIREKRHDLHGAAGERDGVVFLARQGDGGLSRVFPHIHRGLWSFAICLAVGPQVRSSETG